MRTVARDLDLLLHPVRIRIVNAFSGGQTRTTAELAERLPDVAQASLYRHVGLLADAGILEVVDERSVRGGVERRYQLDRERAKIDRDDAATMTLADHRQAFTSAMAALIADFGAYLDSGTASPSRDLVGYRQLPLWLDEDDHAQLLRGIQRLLAPLVSRSPEPGRRPYLLSPILFPMADGGPT